ncbi:MAG: hypothetical protein WAQ28_01365 [Bacteroidia bacterium]|jgi:hypothetical protein
MKSVKQLIVLVVIAVTAYACGGSSSSDVKVAPEMEAFMKQLNGTSDNVAAALNQYGTPELDRKDMDMYNLENAKVISADKECYTMEAGAGMTVRTYVLCWEAGKIKSVEEKGMR